MPSRRYNGKGRSSSNQAQSRLRNPAAQSNSPAMERPISQASSSNLPRAEDIAVPVELDFPGRSSIESHHNRDLTGHHVVLPNNAGTFELRQVQPGERIHEGEVIKDAHSGKHYKKIPISKPAYSLGHTDGAPALKALPVRKTGRIGLGHAFPTVEQDQQYKAEKAARRSNNGSGSRSPATNLSSSVQRSSMDVNTLEGRNILFQQLRELIHEEVTRASRTQTEELRQHVDDTHLEQRQHIKEHIEEHMEDVKEIVEQSKVEEEHSSDSTHRADLHGSKESEITKVVNPSPATEKNLQLKGEGNDGTLVQSRTNNGEVTQNPQPAERGYDDDNDDAISDDFGFPNKWAAIRYKLREPFAEFLGCFMLMIFGNGINNQVIVSQLYDPSSPKGDYLSISFGWGVGVAMGVWVAGGISGGMINPAVTIALAIFRKFPWKKVPIYIFAQIMGCVVGSMVVYAIYVNPIRIVDPGQTETTASLFTTYPAEFLRKPTTRMSSFFNEFIATAILLIVILAIGDSSNTPPPDGMAPLVLLWVVWGLGACLGWQTAYAVNPARDLGPRLMLYIVGYSPDLLWTFDAWYWLWTPIIATILGAILGCLIYDTLCYTGGDSPINAKWGARSRVRFGDGSKEKMPAAISDA